MAIVRIGSIRLPVRAGAADEQRVTISTRWPQALMRSSRTAPALPESRVRELVEGLESVLDGPSTITRLVLHKAAHEQPLDIAYLTVMAWGLGTSGRWSTLTALARRALSASCRGLEESRSAAEAGAGPGDLWTTHFANCPPHGLGSVSFGSKWLYADGYNPAAETKPLIYDANIQKGLANCAGLVGFAPAIGRPRASWLRWCELAAQGAATAGSVSAADIEVALFDHAKGCRGSAACGLRARG